MIRLMREGDIPRVSELEQLCFSDPWSVTMLSEGLASKLDVWYVLEESGVTVGYANLRIIGREGEIMRIAVCPAYRGWGYGKKLMEQMAAFARERGVTAMTLEVRSSNGSAINLYKSYGFVQEAVRKDYYREPLEDGIILWNRKV